MNLTSEKRDTAAKSTLSGIRVVARRDFLLAGAAAAGTCMGASRAFAQAATGEPKPAPAVSEQDREYTRQAIQLMRQAGVVDKTGGPFGAIVVLDGKVLAAAGNSVRRDHDPSAHAEVNAIRAACRKVGSPNIPGAVLYSSCEPCPMCYSIAYWARVSKLYYGAGWTDFADLFDDSAISQDIALPYPQRKVAMQQILPDEARAVWLEFRKLPDGARY